MDTLRPFIVEQPFFKPLAEKYIDLITSCASNHTLKKNKFVFNEGEKADHFYLIRSGRISLETHTPGAGVVIVETLQAGEPLGWSWLIPPYRWHFDARVIDDVRYLAFDAKCLRKKMETDAQLGYDMMKLFAGVMVRRLQASRLQALDMYKGKTL